MMADTSFMGAPPAFGRYSGRKIGPAKASPGRKWPSRREATAEGNQGGGGSRTPFSVDASLRPHRLMFLSPARGRGEERGLRRALPPLPTSPPIGGEELDWRSCPLSMHRFSVQVDVEALDLLLVGDAQADQRIDDLEDDEGGDGAPGDADQAAPELR